jgi:exosome complex component CSL4
MATATAGPGPSTTAHSLLLPGQPLPSVLTKDPKPFLGAGCYEHGGKILSSVVGRPRRDGSVSSDSTPSDQRYTSLERTSG